MKRTDNFIDAFSEWASCMGYTTGNKAGDATRLRRAVLYHLLETKEDALLDDALKLNLSAYKLRNVGKIGVRMYNEFVEWAENIIQAEESKVDLEADKWEQRKFEVAKEVFIALVQRQEVANIVVVTDTAIKVANDFIRIYRQEEL